MTRPTLTVDGDKSGFRHLADVVLRRVAAEVTPVTELDATSAPSSIAVASHADAVSRAWSTTSAVIRLWTIPLSWPEAWVEQMAIRQPGEGHLCLNVIEADPVAVSG